MARKKKDEEPGEGGQGVAAFRGNGFDPAIVGSFVSRYENLNGDLASRKSEFMNDCKVVHGDIKELLAEAKGAGIPKKALKSLVKQRALEGKIEDIRNDLEGGDQESFDQLSLAMGKFAETDLGAAAMSAAA